jgi:cytochrome c-type protein NapB
MRTVIWTIGFALVLAAPIVGADDARVERSDGLDIWFRNTDLEALSTQDLARYPDSEAGESKLIDRAFPGAPPQIPHTMEGMLPITSDENECLECHHPDNTLSKKDLPLPESHFERAVMRKGKKKEPMVWVVKGYEQADDVVGARYDCTMCHSPQASNVKSPATTFKRVKLPSKQ